MSKCLTIGEQSTVRIFPCLPIQDLIDAHKQNDRCKDTLAQNKLWVPILKHLDPERCVAADCDNPQFETIQKAFSKTWKKRISEMVSATGDMNLIAQVRGKPVFNKLELLASQIGKILSQLCKQYETLHLIPRFFSDKNFTPVFFQHLYKRTTDNRYVYLILYFIRSGKDCSPFFRLCENSPRSLKSKDWVFRNELYDYLYYGIGCGIHVKDFQKAGLNFEHVDFLNCTFAQYFLLKKKEIIEFSKTVSPKDKTDPLKKMLPPVPLTEKAYLEEFDALCALSKGAINEIHNGKTALDYAIENHYEKEEGILRKYGAKIAMQQGLRIQISQEDIKVEVEDFEVVPTNYD